MPLQCGTWKNRFLARTGPSWTGSNRTSYRLSRAVRLASDIPGSAYRALGLPPEVEELRPEHEARGEHEDDPDADDSDQRPELRRGGRLQRLDQDPAEERGGAQGEQAKDHCVQGTAEDTAPVVGDGGERRQDVEGGVQQGGYRDGVVEGVRQRGGEQVDPGKTEQGQTDDQARGDGGGEPAVHVAEERRQDAMVGHPVDDPGTEHFFFE